MNENIVVKIGADISALAKDLNKATADIKGFGKATSASMTGAVKDMRVYEDANGRLRDANGKFLSSVEKTARGLDKVGDKAKSAGAKFNDFGKNAKDIGSSMATTFGAATLAIGAGLGFAVKKAADFDSQIRKAGAIAGASAKELDAMKASALELGAATSESAGSVAVAMTELAAKGFTANEAIAAMPGIISAAEASGEDLALAADTVSSALNIFGLEAAESSRVADILAESANTSAAGIDSLGYVLKYAGAPAAALGISLEEVAAAAGIMADAGIDGSSSGTALRASLLALNNPAKAQAKIMAGLGFEMQDSEGKTKSLADIVGDLTKSMDGMTEADKVATLAKLVGTEAVSGFLALTKAGPAKIDKMSESLRNSGGASEAAAKKMKAGIGGALENLSGAFESLTITIGDQLVPYVQTAAKWLAKLADKFSGLSDKTKKFLVVGTAIAGIFTAIVAAIGIALAIVGSAITGLTAIAGAMGIAGGAAGLLSAAFALLTGPIGLTIAAVVGIGAALVLAYKKIDWFREGVDKAWGAIKDTVSRVVSAVKAVIMPAFQRISDKVKESFGIISAAAKEDLGKVQEIIIKAMEISQKIFDTVMPYIEGVVTRVWGVIKDVIAVGTDAIIGAIDVLTKLLTGDYAGAWESHKDTVNNVMKGLGVIISALLAQFVTWFKSRFEEIKVVVLDKLSEMKDGALAKLNEWRTAITDWFDGIKESIVTKLNEWKTSITDWFKSIPSAITAQLTVWKTAIGDWFTTTKENILVKLNEWKTAITDWFTSIPGVITAQLIAWGVAINQWAEEQNAENKRQYAEWGKAIIEWFKSIPATIIENLVTWKNAIITWFTETRNAMILKFGEWAISIAEWFKSMVATIAEKLGTWKIAISNWFTETRNAMILKLGEWALGITNWFKSMVGSIITNLGEWWMAIGKWFAEAPGKIRTALDGWWTKISTWFSEIPARITAKLAEWWTAIGSWFKSIPNKPEIKNMGKNLVDKVSEGNEAKKKDFMSKLGKIIVDVALGALALAVITLLAVGREVITRIISGVSAMKSALQNKAGEMIDAFKAKVAAVDLTEVGKDIIRGLVRGIGSMASSVTAKVKELADLIPAWAKKILGIASPSKVMKKLGMYTGMGLSEGLDGELSTVERSAQALANASIAKPTLSYDTPSGSYGSMSSALSGSVDVSVAEQSGLLREIVAAVREGQILTMDSRKVGGTIAPHVKAKNDMISAFRRNGNGGGVYGV